MWYLIVSIPDLCTITYFEYEKVFHDEAQMMVMFSGKYFVFRLILSFQINTKFLDEY